MTGDQSNDDTQVSTSDSESASNSQSPRRLQRSREHRLVAGVAGGIGERFDVNENLVRAIFMVLTFLWGAGLAIYLVLWAVLGATPPTGDARVRREPTVTSTSHRLSGALAGALVIVALLAFAIARPVRLLAPGLAVAWVAFLVVLAMVAMKTQTRRLTLRRFFAVVFLAGLSAIIVAVGAVMGFLASTGVPFGGSNGDHLWQPTSIAEVAHHYRAQFGAGTLDLSEVHFPANGYRVSVSVAVGALRIVVPAQTVVNLTTNVGAGDVIETPLRVGGVLMAPYSSWSPTSTSSRSIRVAHVTIDANVGVGVIDLMRAPS